MVEAHQLLEPGLDGCGPRRVVVEGIAAIARIDAAPVADVVSAELDHDQIGNRNEREDGIGLAREVVASCGHFGAAHRNPA